MSLIMIALLLITVICLRWSHFLIGNKGSHAYHGNPDFKCEKCEQVYKREANFKNHKCSFCMSCQRKFSTYQKYTGHNCVCINLTDKISSIPEHASNTDGETEESHTITDYKTLKCTLCSKQYKTIKTLKNHKCTFCKKCKRQFSSFKRFSEHNCKRTDSLEKETSEKKQHFDTAVHQLENETPKEIHNGEKNTPEVNTHFKHSVSHLVGERGTLIPDDVIEEAMQIMKNHSPHLAPYIGQVTPAQFQLIENASDRAVTPYIPVDKISINIHYTNEHWVTSVFNARMNIINVYDSRYSNLRITAIEKQLRFLYGNRAEIRYPKVSQQETDTVCGAYAIAFAFSSLLGIPPESQTFKESEMRNHLKLVLDLKTVLHFPTILESGQLAAYFSKQTKLQQTKNEKDSVAQMGKHPQKSNSSSVVLLSNVRKCKKENMRKKRSQMTEEQKNIKKDEARMRMQKVRYNKSNFMGNAKISEHKTKSDRQVEWLKRKTEIQIRRMKGRIRKAKYNAKKTLEVKNKERMKDRKRKAALKSKMSEINKLLEKDKTKRRVQETRRKKTQVQLQINLIEARKRMRELRQKKNVIQKEIELTNARIRMANLWKSKCVIENEIEHMKIRKKMKQIRERKTEIEKVAEKISARQRMTKVRELQSYKKRETDRLNARQGMRKLRGQKTVTEKENDHLSTRLGMRKLREQKTDTEKENDRLNARKGMRKLREQKTDTEKENDRLNARQGMRKLREQKTDTEKENDRLSARQGMRKVRSLKNYAEKQKDLLSASQGMSKIRKRKTKLETEEERLKNRQRIAKLRKQKYVIDKQLENLDAKRRMAKLRKEKSNMEKSIELNKDRIRKAEVRVCQTSVVRNEERIKAWLRMQTVRNHRNTRQKLEYRIRDRHRKEMIRRLESVNEKNKARLKAMIRMKDLRKKYDSKNKLAKKLKDRERKQMSSSCETFCEMKQHGPEYVCTVCQRLLYKQGIKPVSKALLSKLSSDMIEQNIANGISNSICATCERHLKSNKLPPMARANKMDLFPVPDVLSDLTQLECRLIAQRIPFMKILNLPKGKQKAILGSVVNVPVDASETAAALPRSASSSGFIPLKLKRKQSYSGHVMYQMVRPAKVEAALAYLKAYNIHYSSITIDEKWQEQFQNEDRDLWEALVQEPETGDTGRCPQDQEESVSLIQTDVERESISRMQRNVERENNGLIQTNVERESVSMIQMDDEESASRIQTDVERESASRIQTDVADESASRKQTDVERECVRIQTDVAEESASSKQTDHEEENASKEQTDVAEESVCRIQPCCHTSLKNNLLDLNGQEYRLNCERLQEERRDVLTSNPLRGVEFDTCVQTEDLSHFLGNEVFSIAPGEGRIPLQVHSDNNNEVLTFPNLFPNGKYGFDVPRPTKLSLRKYFQARLTSSDNRFASNTEYLFYSQYLVEHKQVTDNINIALRKAKLPNTTEEIVNAGILKDTERLKNLIMHDQGQRFLQNVRGSPAYCRKLLSDLLAMIRQLGPFTFFLTLSAADLRWPDTIRIIASQFNTSLSNEDIANMSWEERCRWIRRNPVTAARQFDYRVQLFVKHVLGSGVLGDVIDFLYRVEFQQRGSPHIHMVIWIKDAPDFMTASDKEISVFVDKYISCALPSNDEDLREKVTKLQRHVHSPSCRKSGKKCRFAFPKPPAKMTVVCRGNAITVEEADTFDHCDVKQVLNKVFDTVARMDISEDTTVDQILQEADVSDKIFHQVLKQSKKTDGIILKRRPCEQFINNYNPKILSVWDANMDIQYVSSPYGCVMYVSSYVTKPEHEMSEILELTSKQASDTDVRRHLQKIASKFLTSREVSAQEAAYRVLSLPLSRSSREVVYVSTDLPEDRLHLLKPMSVIETMDDDDEDIYQLGMIERYMKRPDVLQDLCLAEFVSYYRVDYRKKHANMTDAQLDILHSDKSSSNSISLKDNLGHIKRRVKPAVIRTYKYSLKKEPEKHYHSLLMLYYPWRTDECLLQYGGGSFQSMFDKVKDRVEINMAKFEKHTDVVDTAVEDLEEFGPPEDAWAELAAETELARQVEQEEGSNPDSEHIFIDPDQHPEASHTAAGGINLLQKVQAWVMRDDEYHQLIQSLNDEQRQIFSDIYKWCFDMLTSKKTGKVPEAFFTFVSGSAGTGKSHLIKAIYQTVVKTLRSEADSPDDIVCLLTAPTGPAAFNIHGQTLHSAFSFPQCVYEKQAISQSKLSSLRVKYANLSLLIIDEISMVGSDFLHLVSRRLNEIKGTPEALFGGISVLVFGDLYQLPPVGETPVFNLPKNPMLRLYGTLWDNFSGTELTQIMRQKEDRSFSEMLNRIRTESQTKEDEQVLTERIISPSDPSYPTEAIHLFPTNAQVDAYNSKKLNELSTHVYSLKAEDTCKEIQTGQMSVSMPKNPRDTGGLLETVELAVGARVMITRNVDTSDGLVNGMLGTVVGFYPEPDPSSSSFTPSFVMVELDDPEAGQATRQKYHSILAQHPRATPIGKVEVRFKVGRYQVATVSRRQFPLKLAWASTIHKVQGLTLPEIVVSCEGRFCPGLFYVAVSRVKSLSCLHFTSFKPQKITQNSEAGKALQRILSERPLLPMPIWRGNTTSLCITLLNINSLIPHLKDLQAHHIISSSDVLALTETWLSPTRTYDLTLDNFYWERADRATCLSEDQLARKSSTFQVHGGVMNYIKQGLDVMECSHSVKGVEYICLTLHNNIGNTKFNLLTLYKPPSQTITNFLTIFKYVLETDLNDDIPTVVCGDFNVDALSPRHDQLKRFFEHQGFSQIVSDPTHIQGSCLDHVYVNRPVDVKVRIVPVTWSPHSAVQILTPF